MQKLLVMVETDPKFLDSSGVFAQLCSFFETCPTSHIARPFSAYCIHLDPSKVQNAAQKSLHERGAISVASYMTLKRTIFLRDL
jgi:hypothetical protein